MKIILSFLVFFMPLLSNAENGRLYIYGSDIHIDKDGDTVVIDTISMNADGSIIPLLMSSKDKLSDNSSTTPSYTSETRKESNDCRSLVIRIFNLLIAFISIIFIIPIIAFVISNGMYKEQKTEEGRRKWYNNTRKFLVITLCMLGSLLIAKMIIDNQFAREIVSGIIPGLIVAFMISFFSFYGISIKSIGDNNINQHRQSNNDKETNN